ncbi:hypothetical protein Tco_1516400 [Tanacetum coccineum]
MRSEFASQLHESAGGLPKTKTVCRIYAPWQGGTTCNGSYNIPCIRAPAGSTRAIKVSNGEATCTFREVGE